MNTTTAKITKAEALARYHDKGAGWGDLRNYKMQKEAAALLRKQEALLIRCRSALGGEMVHLLSDIDAILQETEDAE